MRRSCGREDSTVEACRRTQGGFGGEDTQGVARVESTQKRRAPERNGSSRAGTLNRSGLEQFGPHEMDRVEDMHAVEGQSVPDPLILICVGGLGREIFDAARRSERYCNSPVFGFDDVHGPDDYCDLTEHGFHFAGLVSEAEAYAEQPFCVTIGGSDDRKILQERLKTAGLIPTNVIDRTAMISPTSQLGVGISALYGSFVSSRARLGDGVHLGMGITIAHDCVIGPYSTIGPGSVVTGNCYIGEAVTLGAGVVLRPGVQVGDGALIGAGAVVVKNVQPGEVLAGNPAKPLTKAASKLNPSQA